MIGACDRAPDRRHNYVRGIPFVLVNLIGLVSPFLWLWGVIPASASAWPLAFILWFSRMFFMTGFYHRYFSHRTYRMSRPVQFLAAVLGCTAAQKGPIWWASHHRQHHKCSDKPADVHSAVLHGFLWAHVLWLFDRKF